MSKAIHPTLVMVFAKAPVCGMVKTRLVPALGEEGAARLHRRLLQHTLDTVTNIANVDCRLYGLTASEDTELDRLATRFGLALHEQRGGDLGERMANAFVDALENYQRAIIVGTDCPALSRAHYRQVIAALDDHDAAIVPAFDGGYVLMGLRRYSPRLFAGIDWSTDRVFQQTQERMHAEGLRCRALPALPDIDRPGDLNYCPEALLSGVTHEMAG